MIVRYGLDAVDRKVKNFRKQEPALLDFTCVVLGPTEHHMYSNERPVEPNETILAIVPVKLLKVLMAKPL